MKDRNKIEISLSQEKQKKTNQVLKEGKNMAR